MNSKKLFINCALALLTACGSNTSSQGKGDEGLGGGDMEVQQAQVLIDDLVYKVQQMPEVFPEVSISELSATSQRVKLIGREKTFANGVETDATNDGQSVIHLNLSRWSKRKNYNRKLALIFHEVLGIMGLEKNNYSISSRLLVENRFGPHREYQCGSCHIGLEYNPNRKGFAVENFDCDSFPRQSPVIYMRNPGFYSINGSCDDDSELSSGDQEKLCTISNSTGQYWDTLYFEDGYNFRFEGLRGQTLKCSLKN